MTDDYRFSAFSDRTTVTSHPDDIEMERLRPSEANRMDLPAIFDRYVGSNGKIEVNKLGDIVEDSRSTLRESTITKLLDYADKNQDGYITKNELIQLYIEDEEEIARKAGVDIRDLSTFKRGIKAVGNFVLTNDEDKKYYYEHYTCRPPPLFMISMSVLEFAIYIYYGSVYGNWFTFPRELLDSPLIFDPTKRQEAWRFLTYMLLHAGLEHVGFNVLTQLVLGIPLEMVHGGLRIAPIYFAGVIGGSLASSIFDPHTYLVGASGGVYSLFTAQLANVILNGDVMHKVSSLFRTGGVLLILCSDFGYSIYRRFQTSSSGSKVSFVAHVAGAIAGLSMGLIVLYNFKKSLSDKIVFWIALAIYIGFMLFAIFWNIYWPYYSKN